MIIRKANLEADRMLRLKRRFAARTAGLRINLDTAQYEEIIDFARRVGFDVDHYRDLGHRLDYACDMLMSSEFVDC